MTIYNGSDFITIEMVQEVYFCFISLKPHNIPLLYCIAPKDDFLSFFLDSQPCHCLQRTGIDSAVG